MTPSELQNRTAETEGYPDDPKSPRIDKVRKIFSKLPGRLRVLDVGCASGAILEPFARTHDIHGVDISASLVKLANEAGIKTVQHDLENAPLPFPDKSFDVVFCGETIEHHVDTDWLMSEINRVMKTGGMLILTFPNIRTVLSLAMMLFADLPPMYAARYRSVHFRDFTLRVIRIVLRNHSFRLDKAVGSSFYLPGLGEFGGAIAGPFPAWTNTTICVASKVADSRYSKEETYSPNIY